MNKYLVIAHYAYTSDCSVIGVYDSLEDARLQRCKLKNTADCYYYVYRLIRESEFYQKSFSL